MGEEGKGKSRIGEGRKERGRKGEMGGEGLAYSRRLGARKT